MNTAIEVSAVPAVNAQQIAVEALVVETVVSHDTSASPVIAAQGVKATYAYLDQLVMERELWEQNAYRTSNDQLYSLLAKCYQMYKAMGFDTDEAKALRDGLKTYIDLKGYKFVKSTHTLNKIVQCVFGVDRRRVSAYGIVLRTALANNIAVDGLADYIREKGGVEEVRLAKSPNATSPAQKATLAGSYIGLHDYGTVTSAELAQKLDAGKIGKNAVFIGVWQADGSVILRAVVESDTALNAALASYYSATKAEIEKQAKATADKAIEDAKQQAINNAAATASVTA
jgi:hypothetical protein